MLAGRPHEAAGNGSPRWMTAAPRERAHRTRPTGRVSAIVAAVPGSVQELTARARELRVAAGVSQRAMAAHAGVAQSTIASWETGRITAPGVARSRA